MKYKTEWCQKCACEIVECPKCGNTCHFGSTGKVKILSEWSYDEENNEYFYNMEDCDECPKAYEYQREIAPNLYKRYSVMQLNGKIFGYGNTNHFDVSFQVDLEQLEEPLEKSATIRGTFLEVRDLNKFKELILDANSK